MARIQRPQAGFTLLELLVVMGLIGVLSYLGLSAFWVYRSTAALSIAQQVLRDARVAAEAGVNGDTAPSVVSLVQTTRGPISDAAGKTYLPGMQLPKSVKFTAQYDPICNNAGCQSDLLEVKHCLGNKFVRWIRFGDGSEVMMPTIAGSGCG